MDDFLARVTKHFNLQSPLQALGGELDLNYLSYDEKGAVIVKIMRPGCDLDFVEMQIAAIAHARTKDTLLPLPEVISSPLLWPDSQGQMRIIWLQRGRAGRPMGDIPPQPLSFLTQLGSMAGRLTRALQDFEHNQLERKNKWNLIQAGWIEAYIGKIAPQRQDLLRKICARHRENLLLLQSLSQQAIHNDLNDWNILIQSLPNHPPFLSGLIDFGDMCRAPIICDLAIAGAYAIMRQHDSEQALSALVKGFHATHPLSELELELLWPLVQMRLAVSVVNAAIESEKSPGELYVTISERGAWDLLEDKNLDETRLIARLRHACGLAITPTAPNLKSWLQAQSHHFHPILATDLNPSPVLNLSVETCLWPENPLQPQPLQSLKQIGCDEDVALTRYGEPRLNFSQTHPCALLTSPHRPTLSLGCDIFAPADSALHTPLDATIIHIDQAIHTDQTTQLAQIILRHDTPMGAFFTRWQHANSIERLKIGSKITRGEVFATLANTSQNGGFAPHILIQMSFVDLSYPMWISACSAQEYDFYQNYFPNPAHLLKIEPEKIGFTADTEQQILHYRHAHFAANLKLSYREPVMFVRGWRHHLFDEWGQPFLDAYNNVPHVGHAHPRIRRVACEQLARMNSNTRYLHPAQKAFAEKLISKMPKDSGLEICFFVNSGSEANELALRLARAASGGYDMITPDHGYHGNTTGAIDISAYKFNKPGMGGRKSWVHLVDVADTYRGRFRADSEGDKCGELYATQIDEALRQINKQGGKLAGFICETFPSVGGQIIPPDGYLAGVYQRIRAQGGICIADEVQTGLGRLGNYYFAFEQQNVRPDIVVLGKPLGNGHPLAAVVTTREIAQKFSQGAEYFSTFGGSTLSCLMGYELLNIVDDEGLATNAAIMGNRLLENLRQLQTHYVAIGDVRGLGLFIGIDLVEDRQSRKPATDLAEHLVNRLRERHILIGREGSADNVLKIRPPLTIDAPSIDRICTTLDALLSELS